MKKAEIAKALEITYQAFWFSIKNNCKSKTYYRILRVLNKKQLKYFMNDSNFKGIDPLNEDEARQVLQNQKDSDAE